VIGEHWQHVLLLLVLEEIRETPSFEVGTIFLSPRAPWGARACTRKRDEGRRQENIANSPQVMLNSCTIFSARIYFSTSSIEKVRTRDR